MKPGTEQFMEAWPEIGQQINVILDKLAGILGESPEAHRGAYEMGHMLSESLHVFMEAALTPEQREVAVHMLGAPIIFFKERYEEMVGKN